MNPSNRLQSTPVAPSRGGEGERPSVRAAMTSWYARKRLAENPDHKFRETVSFSPKRWTDEALTETWVERKARLAGERGK